MSVVVPASPASTLAYGPVKATAADFTDVIVVGNKTRGKVETVVRMIACCALVFIVSLTMHIAHSLTFDNAMLSHW